MRGRDFAERRAHHVEGPRRDLRQVFGCQHGVDEAQAVEVLGHLDSFGEGLFVERLVDPRPEETDEGAGLGPGELAERAPGGEHAARGRMAQVDEIGKPRRRCCDERLDDLDHLQEGDRALLHPRAARHRRRDERESLGGRPLDRLGQPFCRGDAQGAAEEGELAGDDADTPSPDSALPR